MVVATSKQTSSTPLHRLAITQVGRVGPGLAEKLAKLNIESVQDALLHLPLRYQDRTRIQSIGQLQPFQDAVIQGEVINAQVMMGRKRSFLVRLRDTSGTIGLRFYFVSQALKQFFEKGAEVRVFGEARPGSSGLEMYHPEYQRPDQVQATEESCLTPIYPATDGLSQQRLRQIVGQCLSYLKQQSVTPLLRESYLPPTLQIPLNQALAFVHQPPPGTDTHALLEGLHPAIQRLAFEELVAHQLSLKKLRDQAQAQVAPACPASQKLQADLINQLSFTLTGAQQKVCSEIAADMQHTQPMLRLVQGDVGSGKTLVAAMAALQCIEAGYQVALMAPTEILAEQHYHSFLNWLNPMGIDIAWLSGKVKGKARAQALDALASGQARIAIGTHALFQDDVVYQELGLTIIDEQHRFGVHQRLALREKGRGRFPHQLIMTATPIPRTLAMSAYADLDCSVIDELPPGRKPIQTLVMPSGRRDDVIERLRDHCATGQQAYWVCTLIEESENLQCQAAEDCAQLLKEALPDLNVGLVHGRLKPQEKAEVMAAFKAGLIHLLVATTVIEVGVDVPNANIMIIENPERLGLAQLHQLRGRVGRGTAASYCLLLYQNPLSRQGRARLEVMRETQDGFMIAEKDLEIRGPGEVMGTRQTGLAQFRIADLLRDQPLLEQVAQVSDQVRSQDPERIDAIVDRWLRQAERFAQA